MDARDDLSVAAVAAACTVGLALVLEYGFGVDVGVVPGFAPLGVYFLYLFTKSTPLGALGSTVWVGLVVGVTLATLAALVL